ncbi:MAG TPA: hypothetical protein VJ833_12870 [Rhodanobacteraceae bacterium]|nr:hypothetical protein [Rhodanobacteraceae bacterium]
MTIATFHDRCLVGDTDYNCFSKQPSMALGAGPAILGRSLGRARDVTGIA